MTGPTAEPGPLGEEAARLLEAAQHWLHRNLGDGGAVPIATGAPECAWCPICQLIRAIRGERTELAERFSETQTVVAGMFRALADAMTPDESAGAAPAERAPTAGTGTDQRPSRRVEPIDLSQPAAPTSGPEIDESGD